MPVLRLLGGGAGLDGLGGDAAGGFQDLAGVIIFDAGVFAGGSDEGGAEELFAAVAESATDGFLDLGIGERTLAGALARDQLEDVVIAVAGFDNAADTAGTEREHSAAQFGSVLFRLAER